MAASHENHPLIRALEERCRDLGVSTLDMCVDHLGISRVYLGNLMSGNRDISKVSLDLLRKMSKFLNRPLPEVEVLSGVKTVEDYFVANPLEQRLDHIYKMITTDPSIGFLAPSNPLDWDATPLQIKLMVALMYEKMVVADLIERTKPISLVNADEPAPNKTSAA